MNRHLIFRTILFIGLLAAGAGLVGLRPAAAARPEPRVSLPETSFDFGRVYEDKQLTHTFIIRNPGSAPLEIRNVDPDCACTVASYDRRIAPGGQGAITLSIKPYSVMHQFLKHTRVEVNDPDQPELTLTLKGVVQPIIEIKPSHIIRLRGNAKDLLQGQVRFISHLPGPWEIKTCQTNIPEKIEVHLRAEEPGRLYVLEVTNKSREPGHYAGRIDLVTSSEQRPRLIVRVFADIYLPSGVNP
jgi:hypothetical protein